MITVAYCSERNDRKLEQFGYFEPIVHYLIGVAAGIVSLFFPVKLLR